MSDLPYLGLNPFSEKESAFFFGRDAEKREIARSLRLLRLTVLIGESGVGKSSILQAGVVPLLRQDTEQDGQDFDKPKSAIVVFRKWYGKNPLDDLVEKIRASVAEAMKLEATDLQDKPTSIDSLQEWTKILGGEQGQGQLFIILDQFEEYFQYHPEESGDGTFADEFPCWVNRSDLRVNFLIAIREDSFAKLHRFQRRILNIFDNPIKLKRLDKSAARDAIVKPIGEYNLRKIVADHFQTSPLTVLSAASGMGKSSILKHGVPERLPRFYSMRIRFCLLLLETDDLAGILFLQESQKVPLVTFSSWRDNPVADLVRKVEADLKALFPYISAPEPGTSLTETLQGWTERVSGEGGNSQLFIILDQFEEFFQYQPPEMGEGSFVAEFARAVNHPELPVHFLISIRDKAYKMLEHFQDRIPNIFDHLLQIKQLGKNPEIPDLVKPIEEPDQKLSKVIDIESKLVEEVLNQLCALSPLDLIGMAGNRISRPSSSQKNVEIEAPLLQLVMERLWKEELDKKHSNCLSLRTLKDLSVPKKSSNQQVMIFALSLLIKSCLYRLVILLLKNINGAQRIAQDHFNEKMKSLSDEQQYAMAIVFQHLVTPGGTKIAYPVLQLPKSTTGLDRKDLQDVLDQLDTQRILRTVKVPNPFEEVRYEIFHDILALPIYRWRDRYLLDKKLKEEEEKGKKKARKRILIGTLIAAGIIFSSSAIGGMLIHHFAKVSEANNLIEEANKVFKYENRNTGQILGLIAAMDGQHRLSKLLIIDNSINKESNSISHLQWMLDNISEKNIFRTKSQILDFNFSSESLKVLSSASLKDFSRNGYVYLWNLQTKKWETFTVANLDYAKKISKNMSSVSLSDDGQMLAFGSDDGYIYLWKSQNKTPELIPIPNSDSIRSVDFNSDGQSLNIFTADGFIYLHNLAQKKLQEITLSSNIPEPETISSVSFSGNGLKLAIGYPDGSIRIWDLQKGNESLQYTHPNGIPISSIRFSRNGQKLAIGYADRSVRIWDLKNKEPVPIVPPRVSARINKTMLFSIILRIM